MNNDDEEGLSCALEEFFDDEKDRMAARCAIYDALEAVDFELIASVKEKQPEYFLLENVKNLVNHDEGKTFTTIITTLNELGYAVDFTIINSAEAGLPQSRERTYIVGILNANMPNNPIDKRSCKITHFKQTLPGYKGIEFFNTLNFNNSQMYIIDIIDEVTDQQFLISNDKVKAFLAQGRFSDPATTEAKIIKLFDLPKEVWNDMERQRRVYSIKGLSPTILARSDTTKIFINNGISPYIRKFTPKESFRLQGFDEEFIANITNAGVSLTQLYRQAGNAVSPPVITGILNHLAQFIEKK